MLPGRRNKRIGINCLLTRLDIKFLFDARITKRNTTTIGKCSTIIQPCYKSRQKAKIETENRHATWRKNLFDFRRWFLVMYILRTSAFENSPPGGRHLYIYTAIGVTSCAEGRHNMPPPPASWLLTLKVVSESRVTLATSVPILVLPGLSIST